MFYRILADLIVVAHLAYVLSVIVGLAAILLGRLLKWEWTRNFYFRIIHLLLIGIVVLEALFGIMCPLTTWEDDLRKAAGEDVTEGSFIGRLAHDLLFVDLSEETLTVCYCVFGALVLLTVLFIPPRWPWRRKRPDPDESGTPSK